MPFVDTSCAFISMKTQVEQRFSDYYEKWMFQLEDLVQLLLVASRAEELGSLATNYESLVNQLTAHHKDYYTNKWSLGHEDVLAFFSPVWLSPLENAYLWVTGWKPSAVFRLVDSLRKAKPPAGASLHSLTEDQLRKIEGLRLKMRVEEERVEREMERQQMSMADRRMVELVKMESQARRSCGGSAATLSRVNGLVEVAIKGLLSGLEKVMKMADCVRLKTLKGVLDVLTPLQGVDFLAATAMLQIQTWKWGKRMEKYSTEKKKGEFVVQ